MIIMKIGLSKIQSCKTPIASADPDVISLLKQIIISPGNLQAAVNVENDFFMLVSKKYKK